MVEISKFRLAKVVSLKRFRVFVIFLDVKNNTLVEIRNRWCAVGVDSVTPNKHLVELGYSNPYFTFHIYIIRSAVLLLLFTCIQVVNRLGCWQADYNISLNIKMISTGRNPVVIYPPYSVAQ